MNVLSLFDGMSCGRIALDRVGITPTKYFASEIDKHAIKVSKANWSDIIHIGDVCKVAYKDGTLFTENGSYNIGKIDLLIGGSPCQDFSSLRAMGNHGTESSGLQGVKSRLFYEYLRIKREIEAENPNLKWLLENVKMKKDSKKQLDDYLATEGKLINSSLVSFQRRARYYWTNVEYSEITDKNISFQDYKQHLGLSEYKLNRTKSREKMWANGTGSNSMSCANVTHSDKIYCLTTKQDRCPNSGLVEYEDFCRYLTKQELELAQTVPIGYTKCLSYNQACAVLGNGWTVDIIAHIFEGLQKEVALPVEMGYSNYMEAHAM